MDKKQNLRMSTDLFTTFLKKVFSNTYDREQWSFLLGISKPAISQWCSGKTIPSDSNLKYILKLLDQINEEQLLSEFNSIRFKKLSDITPNHYKFKNAHTLNDYLLKDDIDRLLIKANTLESKKKKEIILSITRIMEEASHWPLEAKEITSLLQEIEDFSVNLYLRLSSLSTNQYSRLHFSLIQYFRTFNQWLGNDDFRPIPLEPKVWFPTKLYINIYEHGGLLELYKSGESRQESPSDPRNIPLLRIYALDSDALNQNHLELEGPYNMIMIIPTKGQYSIYNDKNSLEWKECNKTAVLKSPDLSTSLPKLKVKFEKLKCFIVLFSAHGVYPLRTSKLHIQDDLSAFFRKKNSERAPVSYCKLKYSLDELIEHFGQIDKKAKDIHQDNRDQGILETHKKHSALMENVPVTNSDAIEYAFSLVQFNGLKSDDKIEQLASHTGIELLIPLNNVDFKSVKCGKKVDEIEQQRFATEDLDPMDVFEDLFVFKEEDKGSDFKPIIIQDSEIPHAFQSLRQNQSSKCLHIYIQIFAGIRIDNSDMINSHNRRDNYKNLLNTNQNAKTEI